MMPSQYSINKIELRIECYILSFYIIDTLFSYFYCAVALLQFVLLKVLYKYRWLDLIEFEINMFYRSCQFDKLWL